LFEVPVFQNFPQFHYQREFWGLRGDSLWDTEFEFVFWLGSGSAERNGFQREFTQPCSYVSVLAFR
jgi:hypothetical protein